MHGLTIVSEVPIDAPRAEPGREPGAGAGAELQILAGEARVVPEAPPEGVRVSGIETPQRSTSLTRRADGSYTLRLHGHCDFEIDAGVEVVRVHPDPRIDDESPPLLLGGAVSVALALRGHCVLHASAVQYGDGAVAFVGASGQGRTTVAAICCAAGARLVSDDVLRVEHDSSMGWCFRGECALRLRPAAAGLADDLPVGSRRATVDGREAVVLAPAARTRLPLAAIVAPVPNRDTRQVRVERLRGADAVVELVRHPRSLASRDADTIRDNFDLLTTLAGTVPVLRAQVPWGPPFAPGLGRQLLEQIEFAGRPRSRP